MYHWRNELYISEVTQVTSVVFGTDYDLFPYLTKDVVFLDLTDIVVEQSTDKIPDGFGSHRRGQSILI